MNPFRDLSMYDLGEFHRLRALELFSPRAPSIVVREVPADRELVEGQVPRLAEHAALRERRDAAAV